MTRRPLWQAAAAVALAPAAAFSFANTLAAGERHVVTQVATRAATVDAQPLGVTRAGLVSEPVVVAAPVPDELLLHTAITTARLQHTRALIAAARARAAARKAAARQAAERRATERRAQGAAAHARASAGRARVELLAQAQPQAAAIPAAPSGSWQQIVASLAGAGAGCLDDIIERESGGRVSATNPDGALRHPAGFAGVEDGQRRR